MDAKALTRLLAAFADRPADIDLDRGQLMLQFHDEVIAATVYLRHGSMYIQEGEVSELAEHWIIRRLAHIPLLASRILDYVPREATFVVPKGRLLEELDFGPEESETACQDAMQSALHVLERRFAGATRILYLISDAGEGKTTLINEMARAQAMAYKNKERDWLLLPISLGGRPFIRLDDVLVGSLANRLRFHFLHYESFLELVKMGVVVLALDGFEEMFVERASGEAVSALGNLLQSLNGAGTILIASRKAYFEYRSLETQAKLFDALRGGSVSFARLTLSRWGRSEFLEYCSKRGVDDCRGLYDNIAVRLSPNHPAITRAVLVRSLVEAAATASERESLLSVLGNAPEDSFRHFLNTILRREAEEKWIDRSGEVAQPLLSAAEHQELLSMVALEMWNVSSDTVNVEILEVVADIFCESRTKAVHITRQVRGRITQHALMISYGGPGGQMFGFDHEETKNYFLGIGISQYIRERQGVEVRNILRLAPLPELTMAAAVRDLVVLYGGNIVDIITWMQRNCKVDGPATFLNENCGDFIIRLIDGHDQGIVSVNGLTFPAEALSGRAISRVQFENCYFQPTSCHNATLRECVFRNCVFERLEIDPRATFNRVSMIDCTIHCIVHIESDTTAFDPEFIMVLVRNLGIEVSNAAHTEETVEVPPEESLLQAQRAFRSFMRATEVNENVFRQRLGKTAAFFMSDVLPRLLDSKILAEIEYQGAGNQRRFRLTAQMRQINDALTRCGGHFDEFLRIMARR